MRGTWQNLGWTEWLTCRTWSTCVHVSGGSGGISWWVKRFWNLMFCLNACKIVFYFTPQQRGSAEPSAVVEMFCIWAVQFGTTSRMWQVSSWHEASAFEELNFSFIWFFFFAYKFIYLFIFGCFGSSLLHAGFLQLQRAGPALPCGARASHCGGLSCCGARALGA